MAPPREPSPNATSDQKTQQEIINLRLAEEKLQHELLDLRRPYLLRNPQLLTALIASVGAIIGVLMLVHENYFKAREQNNVFQEKETNQIKAAAFQAKQEAAAIAEEAKHMIAAAEQARTAAAAMAEKAGREQQDAAKIIAEANKTKAEANRQAEAARARLAAALQRADDIQAGVKSRELAAEAEELRDGDYPAAQNRATEAWTIKPTNEARQALVHAFSRPSTILDHCHTKSVTGAVFSPDGQRVATVSQDHTACVWESATGKLLAQLKGHTDAVTTAVFSPDSQRVVTASPDKTARLWEGATGKLLAQLNGHTEAVTTAVFSPDGARVKIPLS